MSILRSVWIAALVFFPLCLFRVLEVQMSSIYFLVKSPLSHEDGDKLPGSP